LRQGDIVCVGLARTHPERVAGRFEGLEGEWQDPAEIDRRVRKLLGTGAFRSVQAEGTVHDGVIDSTLHFEEGEAKGVTYYGGVSSTDGGVFGVRYHDRNLFGRLWNLATGFELSGRGLLGEVRLSEPWFLDSDVHLGGRLFSVTRYYEGYSKFESGLSAEWTCDFNERWSASLLAGVSVVNIEPDGIPRPDLGETVYGHHLLRATVEHEARDDRLSPRGGYHAMAAVEVGATSGDTSASYFKVEAGGGWYREFGAGQLNLGLRGGMIQTGAAARDFPIDLRYFLGGADTVRSFPYRELGPLARSGDPLGGQSYWVANAEWVQGLASLLKGVVFFDAGALGPGGSLPRDPELAAGLGLRIDLPVGPIRLEYGRNLTRDGAEPAGAFHFAIGIAF
jgi:outer membrane protein assembly factor BamA